MAGYILALYPEFACMAGRCPATCCSGWKIVVDPDAYERFQNLEDENLRRDIIEHIIEENAQYHFRHQKNGACAMLDADGLCRIQRNADERMLCNTCRKFPRLMAETEGLLWVSFAASCPVVADYILDGRVSWLSLVEEGKMEPASEAELMAAAGFSEGISTDVEIDAEPVAVSERFEYYADIAMDALNVLIQYAELPYLEKSFDLYEQEEIDEICFQRFFEQYRYQWKHFVDQYFLYRYPSRYLEYPQEDLQERMAQVKGELLLMRIMLCSFYCMTGKLERQDWSAVLHWVYRFCAHGELAAEQNHRNFIKYASMLESLLFA